MHEMNSINVFPTNFIYLNHVFKSFKSYYNENEKFHEIFQRRGLEIFQNFCEMLKYFKVKWFISSCIPNCISVIWGGEQTALDRFLLRLPGCWGHDVIILTNSGFNIFRSFRGQNLDCPIDFSSHRLIVTTLCCRYRTAWDIHSTQQCFTSSMNADSAAKAIKVCEDLTVVNYS